MIQINRTLLSRRSCYMNTKASYKAFMDIFYISGSGLLSCKPKHIPYKIFLLSSSGITYVLLFFNDSQMYPKVRTADFLISISGLLELLTKLLIMSGHSFRGNSIAHISDIAYNSK